jgi:formate--tetrahydrofolate ligase
MKNTKWFEEVAQKWGLESDSWFMATEGVAKLKRLPTWDKSQQKASLILVTAMSPTKSGEGKTTTVIGLTDALAKIGKNVVATLRQPSLGPVFGMKGGATGGGKASVVPKDKIDLGLTGDFFAIESANNMMAALVDNHIHFNMEPHLARDSVMLQRCLDMNDRELRNVQTPLGNRSFSITAASELMAILSLSKDFTDMRQRLGNVVVARNENGDLVHAADLGFHKSASMLMRDALYPNLVSTTEGTPVIMHAGPFANIAQGTNSLVATGLGMELADVVVTEAGFGAELGAEKFFNIKCRQGDFDVAASVLVVTTKAIEHHGIENVLLHVENLRKFGQQVIVAINRFPEDTDESLAELKNFLEQKGIHAELSEGFAKGGDGCIDLAKRVAQLMKSSPVVMTYNIDDTLDRKVELVAKELYRADKVAWSQEAKEKYEQIQNSNYKHLPICIAKTPLSVSDDSKIKGAPKGHTLHIRDLKLQAGAGFIVVLTGNVMTLPGLPKDPRALYLDIDDDGEMIW